MTLKWLRHPTWLRLEDHLPPQGKNVAIYVPGFSLTLDRRRLIALNEACTLEATKLVREGYASRVVISGCYGGEISRTELWLRRHILLQGGVKSDAIHEIKNIVSTADEFEKLVGALERLDVRELLVVSNEYHIPRAIERAKRLLPDVDFYWKSVPAPFYEFAWETSWIKTIRAGFKSTWIAWQVAMYVRLKLTGT